MVAGRMLIIRHHLPQCMFHSTSDTRRYVMASCESAAVRWAASAAAKRALALCSVSRCAMRCHECARSVAKDAGTEEDDDDDEEEEEEAKDRDEDEDDDED